MKNGFILLVLLVSAFANAQPLVIVKGAEISISSGANVYVGGSAQIDSASFVQIAGFATIDGSLSNFGVINQSGQIDFSGNWLNSGVYSASNNSVVQLNGGNQLIEGDSSSNFGQLNIPSAGLKELFVNASAFQANLENSQFHTHKYTFLLRSAAVSALVYDSAWVLSDLNGQLRRQTSSSGSYNFPVGDEFSRRLVQYQPVSSSQAGIRYANVDANIDGLSRFQVSAGLCTLSDSAYIRLYDFPTSGALTISFPNAIASDFPVLCHRNLSSPQVWSAATVNAYESIADTANFTFTPATSDEAYILGRLRPEMPVIIGDDELCMLSVQSQYAIDTTNGNAFTWSVGGGTFTTQSDGSILVDWGANSTGLVSLVQSDSFGCSSLPGDLPIVLHPLPIASIGLVKPELPFEDEVYLLYSENQAAIYNWQFSNGDTFIDSLIQVSFETPGVYQVILEVQNEFACIDTAQVTIEVLEGLLLGNVITPNGDGLNDNFELLNSGIVTYNLRVFNRWGTLVFESDEAKMSWDGRDVSGQLVTPGTYFFVLNAQSANTDYSKKGSLQVIY